MTHYLVFVVFIHLGTGQFLCYQVQALLGAGRLERVLRDFKAAPLPIHVIYPHARLLSANVRAFVDWTVPRLRKQVVSSQVTPVTIPPPPRSRPDTRRAHPGITSETTQASRPQSWATPLLLPTRGAPVAARLFFV